ncbi:MAG TPA: GGDEF domain-containing protein, partial [Polyangiales bacterium]|nr:GGDEF domain-containing protein [Polyangiales bacterium]
MTSRDEIAGMEAEDEGELLGTLTVLVGGDVGAVYMLSAANNMLGRTENAQVMLVDEGISRQHARIVRKGAHYEIEDLGSTNGTWVGNVRVDRRVRLEDGARVRCGDTLLRFALQDQVEQQASRRIYEMSVRDGLTGLYNRRHFDERIESEFAFAIRHGTALCVMMCDIDHFKLVNDRHGHRAGDHVLRAVADSLREGVRTEDLVARYGGEELAIVARAIDLAGARAFAERMRLTVERAQTEFEGRRIAVTLSIGVAHNRSGPTVKTADQLVAAADQALYMAKRAGRNRVQTAVSAGHYSATGEATPPPDVSGPPVAQPLVQPVAPPVAPPPINKPGGR